MGWVRGKIQRQYAERWTNLLTYWSKHPESNFLQISPEDIMRDGVLCPAHGRALESQLKDFR
jgi:hypothetical protein